MMLSLNFKRTKPTPITGRRLPLISACGSTVPRNGDRERACGTFQGENVEHPFSLAKISMTWDYPEVNPFSDSTGSATGGLDWIARVVEHESGSAVLPAIV